jgi:GT2 family glycosyltransferase/tetratricopeptide (TPR) repeat protein
VSDSPAKATLGAFIDEVNTRILPFVSSRSKVKDFVEPGSSEVARAIKPHIDYMVHDGEYPDALKLVDEAIAVNPDDMDLLALKVRLLQRMRRYVEAAELKHLMRLKSSGQHSVSVRREKFIVVDPSEDTPVPARVDNQEKPYPARPVNPEKPPRTPFESGIRQPDQPGNPANRNDLKSAGFGRGIRGEASGADGKPRESDAPRPVRRINMVLGGEDLPADFDLYKAPIFEPHPEEAQSEPELPEEIIRKDNLDETNAQPESFGDFSPESSDGVPADSQPEPEPSEDFSPESSDGVSTDSQPEPEPSEEFAPESSDGVPADSQPEPNSISNDIDVTPAVSTQKINLSDPKHVRISLIVPTAADGKYMLENLLISVARHANQPDRELIVIDNASLDSTYKYLEQLRTDRFMNIRVITNNENRGFAAAVNQGLDLARGNYAFVLHNDVTLNGDAPGKLADLMDLNAEIALMGPVTAVTMHQEQRLPQPDENAEAVRYTEVLDSFALMMRRSARLRFDERYQMAWFEDIDLCNTAWQSGFKVAIARGVLVDHLGGATSTVLGCGHLGRSYWNNMARFNKKWTTEPDLPYFGEGTSPIFQLITISEIINPYYPEARLLARAGQLLTSETRNDIVSAVHAPADLFALIRLMMVMDVRDVLRQLEEQLDMSQPDETLLYQLIEFYYQKHIYSRSMNYLSQMEPYQRSFRFRMMELRIFMGDKKLEEATDLLNDLLAERPATPELYKIAGDIHMYYGNKKEANHFYLLAHQADPFRYSERRDLVY